MFLSSYGSETNCSSQIVLLPLKELNNYSTTFAITSSACVVTPYTFANSLKSIQLIK